MQNERYKKDTLIYLSALQLMSVIIKPVAVAAAGRIDPQTQKAWRSEFGQPGKVPLALIVNSLIELTELQPLRAILQETNKTAALGLLSGFSPPESCRNDGYSLQIYMAGLFIPGSTGY